MPSATGEAVKEAEGLKGTGGAMERPTNGLDELTSRAELAEDEWPRRED